MVNLLAGLSEKLAPISIQGYFCSNRSLPRFKSSINFFWRIAFSGHILSPLGFKLCLVEIIPLGIKFQKVGNGFSLFSREKAIAREGPFFQLPLGAEC